MEYAQAAPDLVAGRRFLGNSPTFPIQGRWPGAPGSVKTGVETTVGNIPSFIPLDNGKQESK
jgi:hypothetical protein